MKKYFDAGIYGAGVMGVALARNLARNNYKVLLCNRTVETVHKVIEEIKTYKESKNISPSDDLEDLVKRVKGPIILLIPSGDPQENLISGKSTTPIDEVIFEGSQSILINGKTKKIKPLVKIVNKNHIIIDAGNSHPYSTSLRDLKLTKLNIQFLGVGVSGGEMGALKGPSIMPGGSYKVFKKVEKLLKDISAKVNGNPCCEWMGPAGAGHLVKIVHNGIEYAVMQGISEAYFLLKNLLDLNNDDLYKIFSSWNQGIYKSYLLEIITQVLKEKDQGNFLTDVILDSAGAKGTGKWTTQIAGDLGIPAGVIYSALEARQISNLKNYRIEISRLYKIKNEELKIKNKDKIIDIIRDALYFSILIAYIQGFEILKNASNELIYTKPHKEVENKSKLGSYTLKELDNEIDLEKVAKIWRNGCIIRSNLLDMFAGIFKKNQKSHIFSSKLIRKYIQKLYPNTKKSILLAVRSNLPYSSTYQAFNYFNSLRTNRLPANIIQALRDLFGAHTYQKLNDSKIYHHFWGDKYSITKDFSFKNNK